MDLTQKEGWHSPMMMMMMTKKKPSARPPHDHQKALCVRIVQYYEYINHIALYREIWG